MGGELRHRERLSITMDPRLAKRVRQIAKKEGVSISLVIERMVWDRVDIAAKRAAALSNPLVERLLNELTSPENVERAARLIADYDDDAEDMQTYARELFSKEQVK
jgi:predicted DNA-binding ribbon-helix-helix protein